MYYIKDCLEFGIENARVDLFGYHIDRFDRPFHIEKIDVIKDYDEAKEKALALYDKTILRLNEDVEVMYEKIDKKKAEIDVVLNFRSQLCLL